MGINTENPISNNTNLQKLLSEIDEVKTQQSYLVWRKSFLKVFQSYLDENGVLNGKDSNYRLLKQLEILKNRVGLVNNKLVEDDVVTINVRKNIVNLKDEIAATDKKIQEFMPKTNADEERFGFDKFELTAVLISDGFHGYDRMKETSKLLEQILVNEKLSTVIDGNFEQIVKNYTNAIDSFVNVMEDLGIFKLMNQCVNVVFDGNERPEPKPPPPPNDGSEDDDDYDYDDLFDFGEDEDFQSGNETGVSTDDDDINSNIDSSGEAEGVKNSDKSQEKKKKKKKSQKKKKDKKASKKGSNGGKGRKQSTGENTSDDDDDGNDNDNNCNPSSSWMNPTKAMSSSNIKSGRESAVLSSDSVGGSKNRTPSQHNKPGEEGKDENDDEENEEEEPPPSSGDGGEECEFLIYFDPKTNTIGQIDRSECGAKSQLIIDASKENKENDDGGAHNKDADGDDATNEQICFDSYQNVIDDKEEKQQIILLLKNLEKTKPTETTWLDEIKKEKAEAKAKSEGNNCTNDDVNDVKKKKERKSTQNISKRNLLRSSSSKTGSIINSGKKKSIKIKTATDSNSSTGFTNPLLSGPPSSSKQSKKKKKNTVEDYQGKYKKGAVKPKSDGWT